MAPQVVYENVSSATGTAPGTLFAGKTFFVSGRTPTRKTYLEKIDDNGGEVTGVEDSADYKIADHVRLQFAPRGSVSYEFIDACIKAGELVDITPHLIFPDTYQPRSIGSVQQPAKKRRSAFTLDDDRILIEWVAKYDANLNGNVMYQELEQQHPQHTWQSWRDRAVKGRFKTSSSRAPGSSPNVAVERNPEPETASSALPAAADAQEQRGREGDNDQSSEQGEEVNTGHVRNKPHKAQKASSKLAPVTNGTDEGEESETLRVEAPFPPISGTVAEDDDESEDRSENEPNGDNSENDGAEPAFLEEDFESLLNASKSITRMEPHRVDEAWTTFAQQDAFGRTGEQWRSFWEQKVRPIYLQQKEQRRINRAPSSDMVSHSSDTDGDSDQGESGASSNDSQNASEPGTPEPAKVEGIEILADDGIRHLSTPIRPKRSPSEKRKHENEANESGSTSPLGERSPLKKRRLDSDAPQPKAPNVAEDSEIEDVSTQAQGFHTAPTDDVEVRGQPVVDLSQMSDGYSEADSESTAAFEPSTQFETAPREPRTEDPDVESSEEVDPAQLDTQGFIDAQLMMEMSSATPRASPPQTQRRRPHPSSQAFQSQSEPHESESSGPDDDDESDESDEIMDSTDLGAILVAQPSSSVKFAPAAFRGSPDRVPASSSGGPVLLPPFSSPKSAKARGKQRRLRSPSENSLPETATSASEPLPADIPAWLQSNLARGVPMTHLQAAVKAASGELELAERVLLALEQDGAVPSNVRGIWTERDDDALRKGYESVLIPIVKKHGKKGLDERIEFLKGFEESEGEDE